MIEIKNLKKTYGDRTVLNIDNLTVNKGEKIVLTGHNGSGKSTLLKILSGVITDFEGEINFEGQIYYLPQQSLPFNKTVRNNILYVLKGNKKEKNERCDEILKLLNLEKLQNKNAKNLSGGECQRLALARIIARKCDLLLLDEPTSAADTESTRIIEKVICEYVEKSGCTLIITSHSKGQAARFMLYGAEKIELCDGELVKSNA